MSPARPPLRLAFRAVALGALVALAASRAGSQVVVRTVVPETPEAALARARQAVDEGNTAAGRVLLDSLVGATSPGAPHYPELLFWRATYAATAAEAERDYRRLAIEYPLSVRAEDALLRLAQLELARGDQVLALRHLERLILEHPESANRARARYWMGRAWLEQGNLTQGCDALRGAIAATRDEEVELRTQVTYAGQRCPRGWADGARVASTAAAAPATVASPAAPVVPPVVPPPTAGDTGDAGRGIPPVVSEPAPVAAPVVQAPAPAPAPARQVPPQPVGTTTVLTPAGGAAGNTIGGPPPKNTVPSPAPGADTTRPPLGASPRPTTPAPASTTPAVTPPAASPRPAAPATPAPATTPAPRATTPGPRWAVQVAAYDAPAAAEALARKLRGRGLEARVDGTVAPYRVRIGRWTRAQAVREAQALKARGIEGFVVEALP